MSFEKINVSEQIKEKCKNDPEFNMLWREKKEYELLRYAVMNEGDSERLMERLRKLKEEILKDDEYMKWASELTIDIFGDHHLRGTVTPYFMLINFESINPTIADNLLTNLFFEYQDEQKELPLVLTGEKVLGKYLFFVLANFDFQIDERYHDRIAECVIRDSEEEPDEGIITAFFLRKDLSIELKKKIVDALSDDFLYMLKMHWEETRMEMMMAAISSASTDDDTDDTICELKSLFENEEIHEDMFDKVTQLIDDKLYL